MDTLLDSTTEQGAIVGALLAPYAAALVRQCNFRREINGLITAAVYAVLGFIVVALNGDIHVNDLGKTFAAIVVAAHVAYNLALKDSANKLKAATSPHVPTEEELAAAEQARGEQERAEKELRLQELRTEMSQLIVELYPEALVWVGTLITPGSVALSYR